MVHQNANACKVTDVSKLLKDRLFLYMLSHKDWCFEM